jgi:hypothetical protein
MSDDEGLKMLMDMQGNLLPELEPYVRESAVGLWLAHPYVHQPFHPGMAGYINKQYEAKKEAVARCKESGDYSQFLWFHERPYRMHAFQEVAELLNDTDYWTLLAELWVDSENIREFHDEWVELLMDDRPGREHFMNEEGREALAALPDEFTIYQGHTFDRDDGWSWTTDEAKAVWFARRFASLERSTPLVSVATVYKDDVLGYLLQRGESEIVVDPDVVELIRVYDPGVEVDRD